MIRLILLLATLSYSIAHGESLHNYVSMAAFDSSVKEEEVIEKIEETLLHRTFDFDERNSRGETPLIVTAKYKIPKVLKFLLSKNVNLEAVDNDGYTALHKAVRYKSQEYNVDKEIIEQLVLAGANLEARGPLGETPLMIAIESQRRYEIVKFLIENGANVFTKDEWDWGLLERVITRPRYTDPKIVRMLIDLGLNVNSKVPVENSPLLLAAVYGTDEIFDLMIEAGADVNALSDKGNSVLYLLMKSRPNSRFIKRLRKLGAQEVCTRCDNTTD